MNTNAIVKAAATLVVCAITAPIIWNVTMATVGGVGQAIEHVKFRKRMLKGMKDGSIVRINGEYYNVNLEPIVEEA